MTAFPFFSHALCRPSQFVSYQEFCQVMTGAAPSKKLKNAPAVRGPGGASAVERAEENLRRIMYAATGSLTQAFLRINRDRSGFVEPVELARHGRPRMMDPKGLFIVDGAHSLLQLAEVAKQSFFRVFDKARSAS